MNKDFVSQFLKTTYTKHQALTRFRILSDFLNFRLFTGNSTISETDPDLIGIRLDRIGADSVSEQFNKFKKTYDRDIERDLKFFLELDPGFFERFKKDNVNTLLPQLNKAINTDQICLVYLPFEIPEPEIEKLGLWFKNISPLQLIEIKYDGGLIGGVALSYKGIYKDFSLRERMKKNQTKIIETLLMFKR